MSDHEETTSRTKIVLGGDDRNLTEEVNCLIEEVRLARFSSSLSPCAVDDLHFPPIIGSHVSY